MKMLSFGLIKNVVMRRKPVIITIVILFLMIIFFGMFQLYLNSQISENQLKDRVNKYIKQNFNKASKIDRIYFNIFGEMTIKNLRVSDNSDFNDNTVLLNCNDIKVQINLGTLISEKRIVVEKIDFSDPEISVLKKYSEEYNLDLSKILHLNGINTTDFTKKNPYYISVSNATISFQEMFNDDNVKIIVNDINSEIRISPEKVVLSSKGQVKKHSSNKLMNSYIDITGEINLENNIDYKALYLNIKLQNIDASYINPYLSKKFAYPVEVNGYFSSLLNVNTIGNNISVTGSAELLNLVLANNINDSSKFNMLNNANFMLNVNMDISDDFKRIMINSYDLSDGNFIINGKAAFVKNDIENKFYLSADSNDMNLDKISSYFMPSEGLSFNGTMKMSADILFNNTIKCFEEVMTSIKLKGFSVDKRTSLEEYNYIKKADVDLIIERNNILLNAEGFSGESDFKITDESYVRDWRNFTSKNALKIYSKNFELKKLASMGMKTHDWFLNEAVDDLLVGYDDIFFKGRSYGKFAAGNDINMNIQIEKLNLGRIAALDGFEMEMNLQNGKLRTDKFTLSGYGGIYSFDLKADFSQETAIINSNASVSNFDLSLFSKDYSKNGILSGIGSAGYSYSVNGYRPKHLVQNNLFSFSIDIANGFLSGKEYLEAFNRYLAKIGYGDYKCDRINFSSTGFKYQQNNTNQYLMGLHMYSDRVNFSASGNCSIEEGFTIPFSMELSLPDVNPKKESIPLNIKGDLSKMKLVTRNKKEQEELVVYDIN